MINIYFFNVDSTNFICNIQDDYAIFFLHQGINKFYTLLSYGFIIFFDRTTDICILYFLIYTYTYFIYKRIYAHMLIKNCINMYVYMRMLGFLFYYQPFGSTTGNSALRNTRNN